MIFLDSSFIIAFYNSRDSNHESARRLMKRIINREFGDPMISDYIFDEVATSLMKYIGHKEAVKTCEAILASVNLASVGESTFKKSFEMFKKQINTGLSFTDCTNIALMEDQGLKNIATFDSDFKRFPQINSVAD